MKTINIRETLLRKRKEKGITQEELAEYIGVSKASVSKWETGASFPDITFLPQLATYFDISIDELMGYDPQMTKEDIGKLHQRLSDALVNTSAEEVFEECRTVIKDYYSCYPLLMQMGVFMLNNVGAFPEPEARTKVLDEVIGLFERVHAESDDPNLSQQALKLEAFCYLGLGKPDTTLVLLEDLMKEQNMPAGLLVSSAYQMKGEIVEAKRALQIGLYENLVVQFNYLLNYLLLVTDDDWAFEQTIERTQTLAQAYDLPHLHPAMQLNVDFCSALGYAMRGEAEPSIDALERAAKLLGRKDVPFDLHGDAYFDLVDPWFDDLATGTQLPRNLALTTESFADGVAQHPAFATLAENKRYRKVVAKFEKLKER